MPQGAEIALAIGNEWEVIATSLGDQRSRIEYELITLLRQLDDRAQDPDSVIQAILSLIKPFPDAYGILVKAIGSAAPHPTKGAGMPAGYQKKQRYTVVPVFYGTDRAPDNATGSAHSFGSARGELSYGVAEVSIPDDHRMGAIDRPRWWKLQFRADPDKHIVLQSIQDLSLAEFEKQARHTLDRGSNNEVLLFVHGFNVDFGDAVVRTAQIAYDLHFEGLAMLYGWPSEGSLPSYTIDEANVAWSRPRFVQFLTTLRDRLGIGIVHVLAHSMGSRLVAEALASLAPADAPGARLRQLAFAAPDIDAATFEDLAALFAEKAERVTLYASSEDYALKASRKVHKYPRAGESGLDLVIAEGVDTIDATAVDTSLLGHSYYGDNRSVIADLFGLIRHGSPPEERFGLKPRERFGLRYWLFSP